MDKKTKIIWGVVIVVVVAAGIYFYRQQVADPESMNETTTTTEETASSNVTASDEAQSTPTKTPVDDLKSLDEQLMNLEVPADKDLSDTDLGL